MRTGKSTFTQGRLAVAAFGIASLAAGNVMAGTVGYTFSQGDWSDQAGDTGTLTGSFAGNAQANGALQLANLTSFEADFHESGPLGTNTFVFNLANTTDFSYDPTYGVEFAAGSAASHVQLCSGGIDTSYICFGLNPASGVATVFSGFFDDLPNFGQTTTRAGLIVTPAAGGTAAPEPANTGLLAAAGMTLLGMGAFRRRRLRQHA
jgi:hypothetical protein